MHLRCCKVFCVVKKSVVKRCGKNHCGKNQLPKLILGVKFADGWEVITQAVLATSIGPHHQHSRLAP